jgi:pimeloyl-ACP methyl ester carboxylesterase
VIGESISAGLSRFAIVSALVAWTSTASMRVARADDAIPKTLAEAIEMEAKDALPRTAFYDPPEPLPGAAPGTLLRSEVFDGYDLPKGATAVRILYHSRALNGSDVAASGVVLIPGGEPPAGGWPLIAWAHGTSGVARMCAPSLMKDVEYGDEGLMPMVAAGFAVVATDYAGLGTPGEHAYLDKIPQASDVIYSVPAARQAVPMLGKLWVAIGHSQGGIAVWGVAEREATLRDPTYLGGVSVAGYMDTEAWASDPLRDPETAMYWPLQAFGIKASYPSFDLRRMLTPAGMSVYDEVTAKGCYYHAYFVSRDAGRKKLLAHANWAAAPEAQRYLRDSQSADKPIAGPLLVVTGDDDKSVLFPSLRHSVKHACHIGLPIEFWHRAGLDHDPLMYEMTPAILRWARARLDHEPWTGNCPATPRGAGTP